MVATCNKPKETTAFCLLTNSVDIPQGSLRRIILEDGGITTVSAFVQYFMDMRHDGTTTVMLVLKQLGTNCSSM